MFNVEHVIETGHNDTAMANKPNPIRDEMQTGVQDRREDAHFRILRMLEENPKLSQRELAEALGISLGRLNYLLKALLEKGLIKARNFRNNDRKTGYAYLLTPQGCAEKAVLAVRFLRRKHEEYEQLKREIESIQRDILVTGAVRPAEISRNE